ncbi:DUF4157 domain-containing protein [Pelatocladus sp. BLCC-F211]|uniref:eCIS core domain-containing protein n=1 Tax=Pelatocladus sp. BLCC-F211 TaxID=3342752 RepID=UPI0035BB0DF5
MREKLHIHSKAPQKDTNFNLVPDTLQRRPFVVQTQPQQSPPATKSQLWENYQRAKQLGHKGENIPVHNPDKIPAIQAKLTINQPGDEYEQEADQVAAAVVNRINSPGLVNLSQPQSVQRQDVAPEEKEKIGTEAEAGMELEETPQAESEKLQPKLETDNIWRKMLPTVSEEKKAELWANYERAKRFGHKGENIPVRNPEKTPPIQPKLTINQPGDKYKQEANKVAATVVNRINAPDVEKPPEAKSVQRQELAEEKTEETSTESEATTVPEEEEETLQTKSLEGGIQRQETGEEEEKLAGEAEAGVTQEIPEEKEEELQTKLETGATQLQMQSDGKMTATADLENSIQQARGSGQTIADEVRQPMEKAFGNNFSGVRVHTDATSHKLNKSIQARAFTTGQDIFFKRGEYNPESQQGQELLAHELTHVVQQNGNIQRKKLQSEDKNKKTPYQRPNPKRLNFCFIMGSGGYSQMGKWFADTYYKSTHKIVQASSLGNILQEINSQMLSSSKKIGQIVIVSHANEKGQLFFPINDNDPNTWITPNKIEAVLSKNWLESTDILTRMASTNVARSSDIQTQIIVKGCNLGQNQKAVEALRQLFGGQATVTAPKTKIEFTNLSYGSKIKGRRTKSEVVSWMIKNGYLPPEAENWPEEQKNDFVNQLFKKNAGGTGIAGIPAEFLLVQKGKKRERIPPSDPRYKKNIAISQPVQPKLNISTPRNKYEREADTVAAQVVKRINISSVSGNQTVQGDAREVRIRGASRVYDIPPGTSGCYLHLLLLIDAGRNVKPLTTLGEVERYRNLKEIARGATVSDLVALLKEKGIAKRSRWFHYPKVGRSYTMLEKLSLQGNPEGFVMSLVRIGQPAYFAVDFRNIHSGFILVTSDSKILWLDQIYKGGEDVTGSLNEFLSRHLDEYVERTRKKHAWYGATKITELRFH